MNGKNFTTRLMWFVAFWAMGVGMTAAVGYVIRICLT